LINAQYIYVDQLASFHGKVHQRDEDGHKTYLRARQNLMGNYFGCPHVDAVGLQLMSKGFMQQRTA
jgi:hypothetical protein